jgi:hypothetical protein
MMTDLSGFTLFKTGGRWQLSTRQEGRDGWDVRFIGNELAQDIFEKIATGVELPPVVHRKVLALSPDPIVKPKFVRGN